MEDIALALQRSAEDDEALIDERIHEPRVLLPPVLLAQTARPIPRTSSLQTDREEHGGSLGIVDEGAGVAAVAR